MFTMNLQKLLFKFFISFAKIVMALFRIVLFSFSIIFLNKICFGLDADSLMVELDKLPDDTAKVNRILDLQSHYLKYFNIEQSYRLTRKALLISIEHDYSYGQVASYWVLSRLNNFRRDKKDSSFYYINKAISIDMGKEDDKFKLISTFYKGIAFHHIQELDSAIFYYKQANKKNKYKTPIEFELLLNLAQVNIQRRNYQVAFSYLNQVIEQCQDTLALSRAFHVIAYNYGVQQQYLKSLEYYKKALSLTENDDFMALGYLFQNIGEAYSLVDSFQLAKEYLHKSISVRDSADAKVAVYTYLSYSKVLLYLQEYNEAAEVLSRFKHETLNPEHFNYLQVLLFRLYTNTNKKEQALNTLKVLEENKGWYNQMEEPYTKLYSLASSLSTLGMYKKAYDYTNLAKVLEDSIRVIEQKAKITRLQEEFKTKEKEAQISLQKSQMALKDSRIEKDKIFKGFLVVLVLAMVILGLFFWWRYRSKVKIKLLQQKMRSNHEILNIKQKLRQAQMNPHFLFNSLSAIKSMVIKNNASQAANYLTNFAQLMRMVLDHSESDLISLAEEIQLLEFYMQLEQLRANQSFDFKIEMDEQVKAKKSDIKLPPMILQPFIENAIIHGIKEVPKGEICISLHFSHNEELCIAIKDNGPGLDAYKSKPEKLHALDITKDRIKLIQTKYGKTIELNSAKPSSSDENGTLISLVIPNLMEVKESVT